MTSPEPCIVLRSMPQGSLMPTGSPELRTVAQAVEQFLEEAAVQNLTATTIMKRRELLEGKLLLPFCVPRAHRLQRLGARTMRNREATIL